MQFGRGGNPYSLTRPLKQVHIQADLICATVPLISRKLLWWRGRGGGPTVEKPWQLLISLTQDEKQIFLYTCSNYTGIFLSPPPSLSLLKCWQCDDTHTEAASSKPCHFVKISHDSPFHESMVVKPAWMVSRSWFISRRWGGKWVNVH
jgi:hypothetical protein